MWVVSPTTTPADLTPTDSWLLSRLQRLVERTTALRRGYEYAAAKSETEAFFWHELADNYLEMAKARLYDAERLRVIGAAAKVQREAAS